MKFKTTKKDIQKNYSKIIKVGYCDLQFLLKYESPRAYSSSRNYGWLCDYYIFNDVVISTGYSSIGQAIDYDLTKKYEEKAFRIGNISKEPKEDLRKLINEFIKEAI